MIVNNIYNYSETYIAKKFSFPILRFGEADPTPILLPILFPGPEPLTNDAFKIHLPSLWTYMGRGVSVVRNQRQDKLL